jgi:hypothetical protein
MKGNIITPWDIHPYNKTIPTAKGNIYNCVCFYGDDVHLCVDCKLLNDVFCQNKTTS